MDAVRAGAVSFNSYVAARPVRPLLQGRRDTPALDVRGPTGQWHTFTFGDLDTRSNRLAQVLAARGVTAGDRVAFCLPNRVTVIDLWLAVVKLGAIAVPINVLYRGREIAHILGDAAPSAVVTTADRAPDFEASCACWTVDALEADASTAPAIRPSAVPMPPRLSHSSTRRGPPVSPRARC